ncbi:multiple organellar RNA editing factor 8, chloroplastic/mitochondrial-like [Triticum urartu]|uniref:multiple organellar RNA editing factor 8, chloroplastic/mitochondrial-like n=1 Tax=Triticum urartu TaxID=4572 RepID=UPI002043FDEA|nr:multiple organellar RNA editing factor 8, chloroplastic/mitochondrial-like [Triticum urartu]
MASATRALLSRLSPLPAAASRFLFLLAAAGSVLPAVLVPSPALAPGAATRRFAMQPANPSPNRSICSPAEIRTPLDDGCDFEHWQIQMVAPPGDKANPDVPHDEIIAGYIKTLAQVIGSEDEARMKIYSVSTRHYFAFGALVSEEITQKLNELPNVRWILPDSYPDVKKRRSGCMSFCISGEPFIDGKVVPYDPKYHEEWVRNNDIMNRHGSWAAREALPIENTPRRASSYAGSYAYIVYTYWSPQT